MAAKRRTVALGLILVAALIAAVVVRSTDGPVARVAPARPARAPAAAPSTDPAAQASATAVNLPALTRDRGRPADSSRNPFRFRPTAPAPAPPSSPAAAPVVPSPSQPAGPTISAGPPPPPPIPLKFIGIVEKADGTRIAVLSDGRRPIHGVEGQELDGQYRLLKVGLESIEISYLDGRGRQTIRLTGK